MPSVLWRCWLGGRKGIRPVKTERWGVGVVISLEQGADLHMAQLMPLPLTVSCFSKIQIDFGFLVPAHPGSPRQRAVKRVCVCTTHAHTQPFNGSWSGTTRVGRYEKKLTHSHPSWSSDSFINFLYLLRSIAYSVFSLRAWQSSLTTSLQVLFGLPLGLGPSISYSMHFFTQSLSSFRSTCPYQCSLFCCNTNAMSLCTNT